ncbi:hypothetical protein CTM61_10050 [Prevotella intermedia]|nr:hypothetical protein CTM61_10050 [Prevotella intermedia]
MINTLKNLLFCNPKAAVLHGKSVGFALQKSRFRSAKSNLAFFVGIIFYKRKAVFKFYSRVSRSSRKTRISRCLCC